MHVNNLPKVLTQRCLEQDLNPRPTDRKPKCLTRCTTTPPPIRYKVWYKGFDFYLRVKYPSYDAAFRQNSLTVCYYYSTSTRIYRIDLHIFFTAADVEWLHPSVNRSSKYGQRCLTCCNVLSMQRGVRRSDCSRYACNRSLCQWTPCALH